MDSVTSNKWYLYFSDIFQLSQYNGDYFPRQMQFSPVSLVLINFNLLLAPFLFSVTASTYMA